MDISVTSQFLVSTTDKSLSFSNIHRCMKAFFQELLNIFGQDFENYASSLELDSTKMVQLGLEKFKLKNIHCTVHKEAKKRKQEEDKVEKKKQKMADKEKVLEEQSTSASLNVLQASIHPDMNSPTNSPVSPSIGSYVRINDSIFSPAPALTANDKDEKYTELLVTNQRLREENEELKRRATPSPLASVNENKCLNDLSIKCSNLAAENARLQEELEKFRQRQMDRYDCLSALHNLLYYTNSVFLTFHHICVYKG